MDNVQSKEQSRFDFDFSSADSTLMDSTGEIVELETGVDTEILPEPEIEAKNLQAGSLPPTSSTPPEDIVESLAMKLEKLRQLTAQNEELEKQLEIRRRYQVYWDFRPKGKRLPHWTIISIMCTSFWLLVASFFLFSFKIDFWGSVTLIMSVILHIFHALLILQAWIFKRGYCAESHYQYRACYICKAYSTKPQVLHWIHVMISTYGPPCIVFTSIMIFRYESNDQLFLADIIFYLLIPIFLFILIHSAIFPFCQCGEKNQSTNGDLMIAYFTTVAKLVITNYADNANADNDTNEMQCCHCC